MTTREFVQVFEPLTSTVRPGAYAGVAQNNPSPSRRVRNYFNQLIALTVVTTVAMLSLTSSAMADKTNLQDLLNTVESGMLLIEEDPGSGNYRARPPVNTDVSIDVTGLLARATVKQSFNNESDRWIEAVYAFPLPDSARVDRLEMRIGERIIKGQIHAKEKAREIYTSALREGQRASLLESQRANLYTNRVANIPPGQSIEIRFSFQWQVTYDDGVFSLRVPLTITPRYQPGERLQASELLLNQAGYSAKQNPTSQVIDVPLSQAELTSTSRRHIYRQHVADSAEINPAVTASPNATPTSIYVRLNTAMPMDSVKSESHNIHTDQTDSHWRVSLANGMVQSDRDFTLTWIPSLGHSPLATAFTQTKESSEGISEHFASVMLMPPQELFQNTGTDREAIFVIDTSGSMKGDSIRQARAALQFAINRLAPTDTFNVVEFNSHAQALFSQSQAASNNNKNDAIQWVRSLRADGGTEISAALDITLANTTQPSASDRLRQIIFITDGSVGNEAELFTQIQNNLGHSRLFTVGIGSAPNTWFMRRAAEVGRGTYTYIARENQVRERMRQLTEKLERPVLTGITLKWQGVKSPEVYPSIIPDLYAGEPVLFDARWHGESSPASLLIKGTHAGTAWSSRLQVYPSAPVTTVATEAGVQADATSLEKQWAHRKIESLENSQLSTAEPQSIKQRITELALRYSMVTRYTSLVAVDQLRIRDPQNNKVNRKIIPTAMPHGNSMLLPQGSLGIGLRIILAIVFLACALLFSLATLRQVTSHEPV